MNPSTLTRRPNRLGRLALVALGIAALLCGIWGGLLRLGLNLPLPSNNANWITFHGPLMVCGFLGTVITLERAVGLRTLWTYAAPALTGAGALMLLLGRLGTPPLWLITLGSAVFVAVAGRIVQLQRALFTVVMALAAVVWLAGNSLWLSGWAINRVMPWWIGFLVLTIVGERLDLSRFQKQSTWSRPLFYAALGMFVAGLILSALAQVQGERLLGAGLLALGAWLGQFDIARRTVRQPGLPRFMAVCLLAGYVWLVAGGVLMLVFSPMESGVYYDAALHTILLGFVFSMIFGHAPVIFPAVLNVRPYFRNRFYAHLILLHLALVLRIGADLANWAPGRQWGGIGNGLAIVLFIANTVSGVIASLQTPSNVEPSRQATPAQ